MFSLTAHLPLFLTSFFAALLVLFVILPVRAQQDAASQLDSLASEAAAAIPRKSILPQNAANVLVADFVETQGRPTALGAELAEQFSASLNKYARNFKVVDRAEYMKAFAADKLSPDSYTRPATFKCYAMRFEAGVVFTGSLDDFPDRVVLRVEAKRIADPENFFDERISLPLTPEMQALLSKPAAVSTPPGSSDEADIDVVAGGTNGYTMPGCIYCPKADVPDEAVVTKMGGVVEMQVEVGADGTATKISIIRGPPCGLNQAAMDSVRKWKFKPANGPDGNPAAVKVPIEVEFHSY